MAVPAHDERDFEFAQKYALLSRGHRAGLRAHHRTDAVRNEEPMVERQAVVAIVKH